MGGSIKESIVITGGVQAAAGTGRGGRGLSN